ncbi:tyrosyl-tRNA synthetase [Saprolegnia parasitica CBS 223.65]|uniref:tyrosine--tRNA ligase n=1 Tax=Saprolegnia parasitica (strain CBS 223.65) TaxID=695850 RepID=A0A067CBX7_SAPPC|nr:tyrosyl-tRNA synthetase [Saprolegnia parasitica CBS 223.65]KDO24317.1 tyrosyl-tRNA synthetase [Saprolegnia parasitica CBS 223.65]|eukprot:XP_012204914.1 tyrosyl-tRNA synthetase [Saprolegnia parasitica CBS 223.65]
MAEVTSVEQVQVQLEAKAKVEEAKATVAKAAPAPRVYESKLAEVREWKKSTLSLEERFEICRSVGEECIKDEELKLLLEKKDHPICYDGFEPSGRMHIAQGILRVINVNRLTSAGCIFRFWVADWFALLNNKMGGDLKKIRKVGQYMIEIWKAAGMNMDNVQFLWASDEINAHADEYWTRVIDVARRFNIARIQRCCTIMGRKEADDMSAAQLMYPCMQCADVFFLKADICQLGLDQRKVNMLAREYCDEVKIKHKPVIISHHMLMGLKQGQEKMSKSDPDSAIFMEDTASDVSRKIKKAYCPPGQVNDNPIMDYMKHIIFPLFTTGVTVKRKEDFGGDKTYLTYEELAADYAAEAIHPGDLKPTLTDYLNQILEPVRQHFSQGEAKKLLAEIKKFKITR